ncbi:glycosyltransferase family 69 protein [Botryobasidium botryosum FD-172 SS1]|uniref:Glycosyltransferase family 69 protein n=1 Tax=Botryobasidium botryosum (strain FD-172 SS1) TaxID=930990 RepID=A0A067M4H5_BOTB1|nr:glycosyltransferase family 69 protein [Botryobasidium botryosum FD-172 SS1]
MKSAHGRNHKGGALGFLNRIPTAGVLAIGVFLGFCLAKLLSPNSPAVVPWKGGGDTKPILTHRFGRLNQVAIPTPAQRRRVLDLLTNLTPHRTRECTRHAQPLYVAQARERYTALVGHDEEQRSSWFNPWRAFHVNKELDAREQIRQDISARQHKYFFAINLYNSFDVIPDIFATLFRVSAILGHHNVFVSIYENGSTDQTKALLRILSALTRSVGLRVVIRTSTRTRGAFNHRIEYLAEVRNAAMVPLFELRDGEGEVFDSIVFMNDVLPCVDDLLELIWQSRRQNAGITCAADYMFHDEIGAPVFYDNWVARDINGTALENAPFEDVFHHPESAERFQNHLPIQVQSCWNGIAVLDPAPMYAAPHIRFRMAKLAEGECSASECSLIGNDYWDAGYGRIIMVPRVKLAYDQKVYDIIHPTRRNLTAIRGYTRLGGLPDNPRTDPQDRSWFGPHDRLFIDEESELLDFKPGPSHVWCWGWDGAGDLDGPDVDPIWEAMSNRSASPESIIVKHDRSIPLNN